MAEALNGLKRTCMCGEVFEDKVGSRVTVMGWVQRRRDLGGLIFVDLRDRTGIVQVVFGDEINKEAFEKAHSIRSEYVLAVTGEVVLRESPNPNMPTGKVEIKAEQLKILSESETPPIYIKENLDASEAIRLKYRYLDLRRPDLQRNLMIRHRAAKVVRDFFDENGFLEIETPFLTKSTPEGARDYLVPSRNFPGKFYALPQSPQIFKQLLMISGFDRYFQIVKCFRDEDLRANRQPEFTQIDVEMSFVDVDDVISLNEKLIQRLFKEIKGIDIEIPFIRMPYREAMERYGSDKPDIRFGMELKDLTDIVSDSEFKVFKDTVASGGHVRAINAEGCADFGRKEIDRLTEFVKTYGAKGLAWIALKEGEIKSQIAKFLKEEEIKAIIERTEAKEGDLILIVADKPKVVFASLGALRLELARKLGLIGPNNKEYKFLWITEFPLLEYDEEEGRYVAVHHPFTSPMDEDIELLETDPGKVRAKAYDIVLNGEEIGGGSIRIHDTKLQERMFKALGFTMEDAWDRFGFLLEAFKYGPPPHGGIAYGFDRLIMFLAETDNIKDVIAFPKNQNAACPLSNAPNVVEKKQLDELGIQIIENER
ncbi:aspartate--tRNA ligase [Thermobrachium celere]|uniref:Aspartate--tRNA ligase n=1 Tax=Thermobrachium celere DSM 8682 TaxID=941824 RepID=R7RQF3_9CLOT|nr:aspartate--tRNA ligase [Thermobrachium celere]GFR35800.1 aspartate--tRNA ligase [Thermobrachium celere]CDF58319.1 Aspartyl-tRNA synthetase [Thermobrachium celere DSM 8682]